MPEQIIKIINGRIITSDRILENATIVISGKKIISVDTEDKDVAGAKVMDAKGNYVSAGFIDIHVHGGGGHDFMDGSESGFLKIAETHAQYGTTSMFPTTLTSSKEELFQTLAIYEMQIKKIVGALSFLACTSKVLTFR